MSNPEPTAETRFRIGVGGWTFAPWRGVFYPHKLSQKHELAHAARHLTSIEINGTFYGSQKPESFARWHDETPEDFVFALKGPRFATNRRVLAEAGDSVERFLASGVLELKDKLGPINWQLAPTKVFDPADIEAFLDLLPREAGGRAIRHALEVRHESFSNPDFVALCRARGVAIVMAGDSRHPQIADATAPFLYARIMGTSEDEPEGYSAAALDGWAGRLRAWGEGGAQDGLNLLTAPRAGPVGEVFAYVISGAKARNPAAAMALIARLP